MASAAEIGVESSNYHGDPNLAGGNLGVIKIDTKPLEDLAAYTFTYNKAQYEQKQKDLVIKAKEYADLTAYDLTTAVPGDRDKIRKGYDDLYNYVKNNPTVLDYQNNQEGWLEYNKKKNDFENQLSGGKVRSIMYAARQNQATDDTRPGMKEYLQRTLDEEANSTGLDQPLKHTQAYDIAPVTVDPPPSRKLDFTKISPNFIGQRTYDLPDMASVYSQAGAKSLGFTQDAANANSTDPLIKNKALAQHASGKSEPVESAKSISDLLKNTKNPDGTLKYADKKFRNSDGSLNIDAVIQENSDNGLLTGVLTTVKQYNDKMREMKSAVASGLKDNLGNQLSFGQGGLNENYYKDINLKDGLSTEELLRIRILAAAKPIDYSTKVTETGLGIQQQNANTAAGHLAETIRNNKADDKRIRDLANLPYEKAKIGAVGADGQPIEFGNIIYGVRSNPGETIDIHKKDGSKVPAVTIKNGVVVDRKGDVVDYTGDLLVPGTFLDNSILTEYNKYVGTTKTTASDTGTGAVTTSTSNPPSKLLVNRNGKYTLRMVNGTIEGIQTEGEGEADKNGNKPQGTFATAEQFEHITNAASQKGVTKYRKADAGVGKLTDAQKYMNSLKPVR